MEKIMKAIGLIVALGVVGIFALTALVEFNLEGQADKGTPFIIESMPTIATWDTEQYKELFIPEAIEEFKSVEGQNILAYLSKLGEMQSFEPPEFVKKDFTMKSDEEGETLLTFNVRTTFEHGDATIIFQIREDKKSYLISGIYFDSVTLPPE